MIYLLVTVHRVQGRLGLEKKRREFFVYPNVCMYITISLIFEYITTCNALQVTSTVRDES